MEELLGLSKTASDHKHKDSKGQMTGASKHEGGEEENPHKHDLMGGGETDTKENTEGHKHKEPDGSETSAPVKTAFLRGFNKVARELTSKGRKQISPENFVFPKEKRYPIHDLPHARNALARVSQFGNASEKKQVQQAVYSKYPGLKARKESK